MFCLGKDACRDTNATISEYVLNDTASLRLRFDTWHGSRLFCSCYIWQDLRTTNFIIPRLHMYEDLDCPTFAFTRECRYMNYTSCPINNECRSVFLDEIDNEDANEEFNAIPFHTQYLWYNHILIFFDEHPIFEFTGIFAHMDFTGKKSYNRNLVSKSVLILCLTNQYNNLFGNRAFNRTIMFSFNNLYNILLHISNPIIVSCGKLICKT